MHPEYRAFLRVLRVVSRYGADMTPEEVNSATDDRDKSEKLKKDPRINRADFVESLYRKRADETNIKKLLDMTDDFICLVGPKGCGKTSMGISITEKLSRRYNAHVAFIDVRRQGGTMDFRNLKEGDFRELLVKKIQAYYMHQLFPYRWPDGQGSRGRRSSPPPAPVAETHSQAWLKVKWNPEIKLWAYLLEYTPEMPLEPFADLWQVRSRAAQMFDAYADKNASLLKDEEITYYNWLVEERAEAEVMRLMEDLRSQINIPLLAFAARDIYSYDRQYVWIDNVDGLPVRLQGEAVLRLKSLESAIPRLLQMVVAVREENVFRQYEPEQTAPPQFTRVVLGIRKDSLGHIVYPVNEMDHPAIGVPIVQRPILKDLIDKRLRFTKKYQDEMFDWVSGEIARIRKEGAGDEKYVKEQIEQLNEELADYSPKMSNRRFEDLLRLSDTAFGAMSTQGAILLSNNSIRDYLMIFRDFLAELLKIPSLFHPADVRNADGIARKLKESNLPLHKHLRGKFSREFHDALKDYPTGTETDQRLREVLVGELNCLLYGPSLYDRHSFEQVGLTEVMKELIERSRSARRESRTQDANVPYLNRLLLELSFPRELLGIKDKAPPEALAYLRRDISTLFLMWIRKTKRRFRIGMHDIVRETQMWFEKGEPAIGCSLPHLIITTVWNLTLENIDHQTGYKRYRIPTVKKVVERLRTLRYEEESIRDTIFKLYRYDENYGHAIEFRSDQPITNAGEIKDKDLIYITYRGKCFVGLAYNTFGYLYQCIQEFEKEEGGSDSEGEDFDYPLTISTAEREKKILPYLCDIAQMHYETLRRLRDEVLPRRDDWFKHYCSWFGIPRLKSFRLMDDVTHPRQSPFRRRDNIGINIGGINRALQLEALLDGVLSYFRSGPSDDATSLKVIELQTHFKAAVEGLAQFKDNDGAGAADFRKALGIEPHFRKEGRSDVPA